MCDRCGEDLGDLGDLDDLDFPLVGEILIVDTDIQLEPHARVLREERLRLGLTRAQLSEATGVAEDILMLFEGGLAQWKELTSDERRRLREWMNTQTDRLF